MSKFITPTFSMPNKETLARECTKTKGGAYLEWHNAIAYGMELAQEAQVDPDGLILLAKNSEKPEDFEVVMEALYEYAKENRYEKSGLNLLLKYVNESCYSIEGWISAVTTFYAWLGKHKRHANWDSLLSYIKGCLGNPQEKEELKKLVMDALRCFGFQS